MYFVVRINYDLQGTSSSFTKLLQGNQLSVDNSSARISVGVFAAVLVRVESQGHTVHVNNALLGGLELHQNQRNNHKLNENLHLLKEQVETRKKNILIFKIIFFKIYKILIELI